MKMSQVLSEQPFQIKGGEIQEPETKKSELA